MTGTFQKRHDRDTDRGGGRIEKGKTRPMDITPFGDSSISRYVNSIPSRIANDVYKYGNETVRDQNRHVLHSIQVMSYYYSSVLRKKIGVT